MTRSASGGFRHDSGILIELVGRPGISGVAKLAVHSGLSLRPAGSQTILVSAQSASVVWCAFDGNSILQNHWEPFDQSSAAAYMPLPFEVFERIPLEGGGVFLVQRAVRNESLRGTAVDDGHNRLCEFLAPGRWGEVGDRLSHFLRGVGVPTKSIDRCVQATLDRFSNHTSQDLAA